MTDQLREAARQAEYRSADWSFASIGGASIMTGHTRLVARPAHRSVQVDAIVHLVVDEQDSVIGVTICAPLPSNIVPPRKE